MKKILIIFCLILTSVTVNAEKKEIKKSIDVDFSNGIELYGGFNSFTFGNVGSDGYNSNDIYKGLTIFFGGSEYKSDENSNYTKLIDPFTISIWHTNYNLVTIDPSIIENSAGSTTYYTPTNYHSRNKPQIKPGKDVDPFSLGCSIGFRYGTSKKISNSAKLDLLTGKSFGLAQFNEADATEEIDEMKELNLSADMKQFLRWHDGYHFLTNNTDNIIRYRMDPISISLTYGSVLHYTGNNAGLFALDCTIDAGAYVLLYALRDSEGKYSPYIDFTAITAYSILINILRTDSQYFPFNSDPSVMHNHFAIGVSYIWKRTPKPVFGE